MDFAHIPVFGQSVKPGLGLRFRGNYWAFFDKRTELSPWLILHRESVNDTELDELLLHGFPRTRTGDTVDCKVLTHFGLIQGDLYEDGWTVGRTERQRTAAFTGDVLVVKIPLSANPQKDLLDPESIYWSSQTKLVQHAAGSPEHERGKALVEMASILLARWREHDTQNTRNAGLVSPDGQSLQHQTTPFRNYGLTRNFEPLVSLNGPQKASVCTKIGQTLKG